MRIVVIGGNAGTGAHVVHQALQRGDEVVSVSRSGWTDPPEGVEDVRLDATASAGLDQVLTGADAVVVAVGASGFDRSRPRTRVTEAVVSSLGRVGARPVVAHSSLGVGDSLDLMKQPVRTIARVALGIALADHGAQEDVLARSGLPWASVRPGGLSDDPARGDVTLTPTADAAPGAPTGRITRADVAAGILQVLDEGLGGTFVFVPR
ncbi:MAG: SDR family oxidoreductase [Propionibacteriaceae bacterium]|nr:SDR family oxidoreductase [Propionibacteriaceae bacterium]